MNPKAPTREEALTLLREYNKSESLIKHAPTEVAEEIGLKGTPRTDTGKP